MLDRPPIAANPTRRRWLWLAGAAPLLALSACATPLPTERASYAGDWQGLGMRLIITPDGSVAYRRLKAGMQVSITGPLKAFDEDHFIVGIGPFATRFVVSQPPQWVQGEWQMTVDGVTLTRRR